MQFVVLVAFALVFAPIDRPAWPVVAEPAAILAILGGQVAAVVTWAAWTTRRRLRQLDRDPAGSAAVQRRHGTDTLILCALLLAGLTASVWGTAWPQLVRERWRLGVVYGLDELVILAPFFVTMIAAWAAMYPVDRAIRQLVMEANLWEGLPARPPWGVGRYLSFFLRHQVLIVALPMMLIVAANDFVQVRAEAIRRATRLYWGDQVVLVLIAGLILLLAPLLVRVIWSTSVLPASPLRARLEAVSRRLGLRYRGILVWHSEGMAVNAAVIGVVPSLRYVLLSDGLIEKMEDEKIEAVFGHEAGHVIHLHMPYYLLFAILSMLIVGGVSELLFGRLRVDASYVTLIAVAMIVGIWGLGFGWISRRFERQADLFGARTVAPSGSDCDVPCRVHASAAAGEDPAPAAPDGLCAAGARIFSEALGRIARLNGIAEDAHSWRHGSIASRVQFLRRVSADPAAARRFARTILGIKAVLVLGTAAGLIVAVWLYSDLLTGTTPGLEQARVSLWGWDVAAVRPCAPPGREGPPVAARAGRGADRRDEEFPLAQK